MTGTKPPGKGSPAHPRPNSLGANRPAVEGARLDDPGGPRSTPPAEGSSWLLSALVYGAVVLVGLGIGAAVFFVTLSPTDHIRREIIARVKAETGRELTIAGPVTFTVFPTLGLRLGDVTLSAPPGMTGGPFLTASSIDVGVKLLPLLRSEVIVERLELADPTFSLRVDRDGRRSWDMAGLAVRSRFADAAPGLIGWLITPAAAAPQPAAAEMAFDDIRIVDGAVRYNDDRNGAWARFDGLNARFSSPSPNQPVTGDGTLTAAGETFKFRTMLATPADLMQGRQAKLSLEVGGAPITLRYEGEVGEKSAAGALSADADSLSGLAAWWGTPLRSKEGDGAVTFRAALDTTETAARLNEIDLKMGPATIGGSVGFAQRAEGQRPIVTADLRIADATLGGLPLGDSTGAKQRGGVPAPTPLSLPAGEPSAPARPRSIDDLLDEPAGPRVKGYTQRAGWSTEPIDAEAFALFDADAHLALSDVTYDGARIDAADVKLNIADRVAKVALADLRLYGGTGEGLVTVDATNDEVGLTSRVALSKVDLGPLLRDGARVDWLTGTGNLSWDVSGRGTNEATIVQSLSGVSRVSLSNGAVTGFDLGAALDELSQGSLPSLERDPKKKTPFTSLKGSFKIDRGVASNNDLKLDSRHVEATGSGTVDVARRSLDYTLRPKLVTSLEGENGQQDAIGIEVPVQFTGSWEEPDIQPDFEGAINSPATVDAMKQIGKRLNGKSAGEIVQDLFGEGQGGEPSKAQKLLDKLLGK